MSRTIRKAPSKWDVLKETFSARPKGGRNWQKRNPAAKNWRRYILTDVIDEAVL